MFASRCLAIVAGGPIRFEQLQWYSAGMGMEPQHAGPAFAGSARKILAMLVLAEVLCSPMAASAAAASAVAPTLLAQSQFTSVRQISSTGQSAAGESRARRPLVTAAEDPTATHGQKGRAAANGAEKHGGCWNEFDGKWYPEGTRLGGASRMFGPVFVRTCKDGIWVTDRR